MGIPDTTHADERNSRRRTGELRAEFLEERDVLDIVWDATVRHCREWLLWFVHSFYNKAYG